MTLNRGLTQRLAILSTLTAFAVGMLAARFVMGQEYPTTPVKGGNRIVVLTFSMPGCPHCQDAAPTWELLRKDGVLVVNYDTQRDRSKFDYWEVPKVPTTLVAIVDAAGHDREMLRVDGSRPYTEYRAMVDRANQRLQAGIPYWPASVKEIWALPKPPNP